MTAQTEKEIEDILTAHLEQPVVEDDDEDDDEDDFKGKYSFSLFFYSFVDFFRFGFKYFQ